MSPLTAVGIFLAGLAAGAINTIVGSGSLITFPTLLAAGYSPVLANVTNTVGLVPGVMSGSIGYRRELKGQAGRIRRLGVASVSGGVTGAVLLLTLPGDVFKTIVPVLILAACVLVAVQPRLSKWLASRQGTAPAHGGVPLFAMVFATGVYGGYFGAAQGVILFALLSTFIAEDLQRLNAVKNVLAMLVNGVAAVLFVVFSHIGWSAAGILAAGAMLGGQLGATVGRRLPSQLLRGVIVVGGTAVAAKLIFW